MRQLLGRPLAQSGIKTCDLTGLFLWRRERLSESEGFGRRSTFPEQTQSVDGFLDGWDVSCRNPPQGENRAFHRFEPLLSLVERANVRAAIHELLQRLERFPHRHVDRHPVIV